jgi:hypothetical protein
MKFKMEPIDFDLNNGEEATQKLEAEMIVSNEVMNRIHFRYFGLRAGSITTM